MKKWMIILAATSIITGCARKSADGNKLAKDVCDCYSKANGMDATDPKRTEKQNDCLKKQQDAWNEIKDDQKKAEEFNNEIGQCGKEQVQKALGK